MGTRSRAPAYGSQVPPEGKVGSICQVVCHSFCGLLPSLAVELANFPGRCRHLDDAIVWNRRSRKSLECVGVWLFCRFDRLDNP